MCMAFNPLQFFCRPVAAFVFLFFTVTLLSQTTFAVTEGEACSVAGQTSMDNNGNTFSTFICDGANWVILTQGTTSGYLGINKSSPEAPLDVAGEIKVGASTGILCNSSNEGTLRFDSTTKVLEICTGATWDSLNLSCDNSPSGFDIPNTTGASTSTSYPSSIVQITDISCPTLVSISGSPAPEFRICNDATCSNVAVAYGSTSQNITNGQYIQVRNTSDSADGKVTTATLNVGSAVDNYNISTTDNATYKRVFITSSRYRGNFGGVTAADNICMSEASAAGLSGTYYAWVATDATNDPESRFTRATVPYRFVDGTKMANDWTDLVDGAISVANKRMHADGNVTGFSSSPWTGVNQDGTAYLTNGDPLYDNCNKWTTNGSAYTGRDGANNTTGTWSSANDEQCNQQNWLYCFEQ